MTLANHIQKSKYDNFHQGGNISSGRSQILNSLERLEQGQESAIWTSSQLASVLEKYQGHYLENSGYIITAFNRRNPYGTYALGYLNNSQEIPQDTTFRISKCPSASLGLKTIAPTILSTDELCSAPFKYIPTSAQVVSVFTNGAWHKNDVIPASHYTVNGMTSTTQYGQSAFEGLVATKTIDGDASIFRPMMNADRFNRSLTRLGIPPLPEGLFLSAVEQAVRANYDYLPPYNAPARLYLRPYVIALNGGTKVAPATEYVFTVQAFPFCSYSDPNSPGLNLVTIAGTERALPGIGDLKLAGNYATTLAHSTQAHQGLIKDFDGKKFDGVFYTYKVPGNPETFVDEFSAANLFFAKNTNQGLEVYTPTLKHNRILPGVTRDSIIALLNISGIKVIETDIDSKLIRTMDSAFLTGSAAGITEISSMAFSPEVTAIFGATAESTSLIKSLKTSLSELRAGKTDSFENSPAADWPHIVKL